MSDEPELLALRARNATLEGACRSAGICMSCLYGAADPIGCTDCLGTGWDGGDPRSQIEVLESRVAKLAAAVLLFHRGGPWTMDDMKAWEALTGSREVTTKALCDFARKAQA
jgi:hypothetical protein